MSFETRLSSTVALSLPDGRAPRRAAAPDVVALALLCLLAGLFALAGAAVAPGLHARPVLCGRILGLGLLLVAVGAGLLLGQRWARGAVLGMLAYAAVAQLTQGWLQDDVLAAFFEALSGQGGIAVESPLGPLWSLALCGATGWYLLRLSGASLRAAFSAGCRPDTANDPLRARND
jgi:hypothetical protein